MRAFTPCPLKPPCVCDARRLGGRGAVQEWAGASWAAWPPVALSNMQSGHLQPQGCCRLCLLEHFTLASVFLLGLKMPRGFADGLPCPHPAPQFTICLFSRCTEIRHQSLGTQAVLSISRWRCISFVLSPDIGITSSGFFFSFLSSAFNFLSPLTSVFFAFFHSFLFSLCIPLPPYVFGFW